MQLRGLEHTLLPRRLLLSAPQQLPCCTGRARSSAGIRLPHSKRCCLMKETKPTKANDSPIHCRQPNLISLLHWAKRYIEVCSHSSGATSVDFREKRELGHCSAWVTVIPICAGKFSQVWAVWVEEVVSEEAGPYEMPDNSLQLNKSSHFYSERHMFP